MNQNNRQKSPLSKTPKHNNIQSDQSFHYSQQKENQENSHRKFVPKNPEQITNRLATRITSQNSAQQHQLKIVENDKGKVIQSIKKQKKACELCLQKDHKLLPFFEINQHSTLCQNHNIHELMKMQKNNNIKPTKNIHKLSYSQLEPLQIEPLYHYESLRVDHLEVVQKLLSVLKQKDQQRKAYQSLINNIVNQLKENYDFILEKHYITNLNQLLISTQDIISKGVDQLMDDRVNENSENDKNFSDQQYSRQLVEQEKQIKLLRLRNSHLETLIYKIQSNLNEPLLGMQGLFKQVTSMKAQIQDLNQLLYQKEDQCIQLQDQVDSIHNVLEKIHLTLSNYPYIIGQHTISSVINVKELNYDLQYLIIIQTHKGQRSQNLKNIRCARINITIQKMYLLIYLLFFDQEYKSLQTKHNQLQIQNEMKQLSKDNNKINDPNLRILIEELSRIILSKDSSYIIDDEFKDLIRQIFQINHKEIIENQQSQLVGLKDQISQLVLYFNFYNSLGKRILNLQIFYLEQPATTATERFNASTQQYANWNIVRCLQYGANDNQSGTMHRKSAKAQKKMIGNLLLYIQYFVKLQLIMASYAQKREKKLNDHKELAQKQKDATEKFADGKKIMQKENKSAGDYERAIQLFSEAITLLQNTTNQTESSYAKFYAARGNAFMQTGQYQRALYDFSAAVRFDEYNASHYGSRGNCLLQLNQINEALQEFQRAIQLNPTDGYFFLNRALVYARLENYNNAIDDYTQALKFLKEPNAQFKAHFHMGNCYRQIKKYDKSIEHLQKACEIKKDEAPAHNNLGLSFFENQQYDLALDRFSKSIEYDEQKATYYNNKALALYHLGDLKGSLLEYNRAIQLDETDARTLYNRGNTFLALGKNEEAHHDFDAAIKLMPTNSKFFHSKGLAYQDTEQYDQAIKMFEKALDIAPDHVPSIYHLGLMQHRKGDLSDSLNSFSSVLNAIGKDRLVYESRGLVYMDMKNYQMAIEDFDQAIAQEPTFAETYYYRGLARIEIHQLKEAIDDFNLALELDSKNPGIFSGIGQAYRLQQNYDKALYYMNKALEKSPNNQEFLVQRSNIFVDIRDYQRAIDDLSAALDKKPNDPQIYYKRGLAYYKNKEFKLCIRDLYKSFENKPFHTYEADIHYHLGISFANLEYFDKAIEPLTKAHQMQKYEPCYIHERAKCYLLVNENQKALDDFNEVIQMQTNNAHAYFGRAFARKALKDYDNAAEDFERAKQLDPLNPRLIINPKQIYYVKYIKLCNPGEEEK